MTLALIANSLSPIEQGYYYTFASLAALQVFADMGLSSALVYVAAHEFAGLSWTRKGQLVGGSPERFLALTKKSLIWSGAASLLFVLIIFPSGLVFISNTTQRLPYAWQGPWLLLVIGTGASCVLQPLLAIIEGSGDVLTAYKVRFAQSAIGVFAVWVSLAAGGGLYAAAMMPTMFAITALLWLSLSRPHFIVRALTTAGWEFKWKLEVWSMQWRIGVSWICGYLLVQIHTPLLFYSQDAVVAGQMGLTMTVSNMIGLLAMTWVTAQAPLMAKAVASRDWENLDQRFRITSLFSILAFLVLATAFIGVRIFLEGTVYDGRLLPIMDTLGLVLATLLSHVAGLFAVYLRAHRREPLMWLSIVAAILTASGAIWAAPAWGATGIVVVLISVNLLFGFPATLWIWNDSRKKWHLDTQDRLI